MDLTAKEIFTIYWPQVLLFLGALGYILKSFNDVRIKKSETKYSHYQNLKVEAITDYIAKFHLIEKSYNEVNHHAAFTNKIPAEKYDELFFYRWREYEHSFSKLLFLLPEKESTHFKIINSNLEHIASEFNQYKFLYSLRDEKAVISKRVASFSGTIISLTKKNKIELIKAGKDFQRNYQ